jgi:hypothetical protein
VLPDNRSMLRVFESAGFGVDAVIVLFVPPVVTGAEEVAAAIRRAADGSKPVLPVVMGVAGTTYGCRRSTCARCFRPTAHARRPGDEDALSGRASVDRRQALGLTTNMPTMA